MKKKEKIIKYRSKRYISLINIIFIIILLYLGVQIYSFFTKRIISIYEIGMPENYSFSPEYVGIITRNEKNIYVGNMCYVNYAVSEGDKVRKGSTVYTTSDSSKILQSFAQTTDIKDIIDHTTVEKIKERLVSFQNTDIDNDFSEIYNQKADIHALVHDSVFICAYNQFGDLLNADGGTPVLADEPGYIVFHTDNYDGLTPENITEAIFDKGNYSSEVYCSGEIREAGSFAYKIVEDDSFSITFPLDDDELLRLRNKKNIQISFPSISTVQNGKLNIFTSSDGQNMATVSFSKYGALFLNERFVEFSIIEDNIYGYKIPKSSVITKDYLIIPSEFLFKGTDGMYVLKDTGDTSEHLENDAVKVSIYASKGDTYYISSAQLKQGDYLLKPEKNSSEEIQADYSRRYLLSFTAPLTGTYNVNKGYCIFRQVDILSETKDSNYFIINTGTSFGLSSYDRIILDAEMVTENELIY